MIEYELNVPNLDCMEEEELATLRDVFSLLSSYCERKSKARQLRLSGRIDAATQYENMADTTYRMLPQWARW